MGLYNLDSIFDPGAVAVVGASEKKGTIGNALVKNMLDAGFPGDLVPVNPHSLEIEGLKTYKSVADIGRPVDLAAIATPIATVLSIVEECVEAGVKGAVIISAGGKESGEEGRKLEERIKERAEAGGLRIVGPNCLGVICPQRNLNASFAAHMPYAGKLAFISQSGAICTAILDLSMRERIGFRYFVSIGSMLDVDFGDLIDYLGSDAEVQSLLLYIESLTNFRKFMSAARAVSRIKPIVVLKSGRSAVGARAASSHTGALAGEDSVYDAAFKRAGIVRVNSIEDLFDCAELLAKQERPAGPRLAVITNSGGPGVMAADAVSEYGLEMSSLEDETVEKLDAVLPPYWSHGNPVDILGDATAERYTKTVECFSESRELDGMLVILNPQAMTDPGRVAKNLIEPLQKMPYPVFTAWMGGVDVERGIQILNEAGLPTYDTPERAIRAFKYLWDYASRLKMLQEIPLKLSRKAEYDRARAGELISKALQEAQGRLTEVEAKEVLSAYGLPVNRTEVAGSEEEAVRIAGDMGFPLVMKVHSKDILHKTEADGVHLDLRSEDDVKRAYQAVMEGARAYDAKAEVLGVTLQEMIERPDVELLIGAKKDANFGPVVLFGLGGIYAEVLGDRNIGLPPLNRLLARQLMEGTRIYSVLKGYRGRPQADLELLEEMIIRLSQLLVDFPEISELDMNPVVVDGGRPCAVDARMIVEPGAAASPRHLVISPYPEQYESHEVTEGDLELFVRPIKPEDAPLLVQLFDELSPTSVYYRFFSPMKSLPHHMLARFTQIDYDREMALVAIEGRGGEERMLGVARIIGRPDGKKGEFAVAVGDRWQGQGVGAKLLERCLRIVKERGMEMVYGVALRENTKMIKLARKLGFKVSGVPGTAEHELRIDLKDLTI